ncbi:MAG: 3-phosphoshikimate 1-carboxyvinyltransferase [Bifidobacteriaceae bacterium]|nr:3-phosphoshikimate 1-carboxyvinyltransferase [Bifidobacteriaceae bacterium]
MTTTAAYTDPWPAPHPAGPIHARVTLPGSKSVTARYLVLAALAHGPSRLEGALLARDTELMAAGLEALGASIEVGGTPGRPIVDVTPGPIHGPATVDCGLAGTVMRFLLPVAALADGPVRFDGDEAARRRPMAGLIDALRGLGVDIEEHGAPGHLPLTVHGRGRLPGGTATVEAAASSQFLSALLIAAPRAAAPLTVAARGPVPSMPHVHMTLDALRDFGATVTPAPPAPAPTPAWTVTGPLHGRHLEAEPDLSNAGPFLAAALAVGGTVTVPGWPAHTNQPGALLPHYLERFGARAELTHGALTVGARPGPFPGADLDLTPAGELAPTLAAVAALAATPSRLTGIGHLRGHETDRLAAIETELTRLGGRVRQLPDGLAIDPAPLHAAAVETYGDHRIATFAAVIGLAVPGVRIRDIGTTSKTIPDFPSRWARFVETA